ncbi:MAG: hypothetical protein AAFQ80_07910 [Cyanobacteria bacterium J06621_8]
MNHQNSVTEEQSYFPEVDGLPPTGSFNRAEVTGYNSQPQVIDTDQELISSETVEGLNLTEENPYLRLLVIAGIMAFSLGSLWLVFGVLLRTPQSPVVEVKEQQQSQPTVKAEPDYQAKLALKDQQHHFSQTSPPKIEVKPEVETLTQPQPQPIAQPVQPAPPIVSLRPAPAPVPQQVSTPVVPEVPPQEQWQSLADSFGSGVQTRKIPQPKAAVVSQKAEPSSEATTIASRSVSLAEQNILSRRRLKPVVNPSVTQTVIDSGLIKAEISLPLVWDGSISAQQQQSREIVAVLKDPVFDSQGKTIFSKGVSAVIQVNSISSSGLISAHVTQIDGVKIPSGELILRDKKKSALVAKSRKTNNFSNLLAAGGVSTVGTLGEQLLTSDTSVVSNGFSVVSSQTRNNVGRDVVGSALSGFGSALADEFNQNREVGTGQIYVLPQGETVYLSNIRRLYIQN